MADEENQLQSSSPRLDTRPSDHTRDFFDSPASSSSSSPEFDHRFDSAVILSPTSPKSSPHDNPPTEHSPLLSPQITSHRARQRAATRQTIPSWLGILIVLGVLAWTTWLAMFVVWWLWSRTGREDDGFGGWSPDLSDYSVSMRIRRGIQ